MSDKPAKQFHDRHFPVRPNLDQLKHQAKDLLRATRQGDADAVAALRKHHPGKAGKQVDPLVAKLADAQFALARSYGLPSWTRLVTACRMTDAIWRGDVEAVRKLVTKFVQTAISHRFTNLRTVASLVPMARSCMSKSAGLR